MQPRAQKIALLLLILVPAAVYGVIGELNQLKVLSIDENCPCYPGLTAWGYALEGLTIFLVINVFLLPLYFSKMLPRQAACLP